MNLNKGCIEIYLAFEFHRMIHLMNLNKGCIEIFISHYEYTPSAADEP